MSTFNSNQIIHNVWAVGRNYADHASEMKAEVPKSPMIFLKAGTSINTSSRINLPAWSQDIHHELEIAFWLNENLEFSHLTLALDLTARDEQSTAKAKGQPWTKAKSFKGSCPLGGWISLAEISDFNNLEFTLKVNDILRQHGHVTEMIFSPEYLLKHIREIYPVTSHDVLLTGTPAGVARLQSNDKVEAALFDKNTPHQPYLQLFWDVV